MLVGDPRQVTYLTHHSAKYKKYKDGKIDEFIKNECKKDICEIDANTLKNSHRNNKKICEYSSKLFQEYEQCEPCNCKMCRNYEIDHEGVFLVNSTDVEGYCKKFSPTILRWSKSVYPDWNFGKSKGKTFDRVLIYPTKSRNGMTDWIKNNSTNLSSETRCKFYVAVTRARYSVGIVYDYNDNHSNIEEIEKYIVEEEEQ